MHTHLYVTSQKNFCVLFVYIYFPLHHFPKVKEKKTNKSELKDNEV